jgi:hypothetical protein
MPLLIAQLLPTKAEHNSRKNARTSQKSPAMVMQCLRSSRGYGNFLPAYRMNVNGWQTDWKNKRAAPEELPLTEGGKVSRFSLPFRLIFVG